MPPGTTLPFMHIKPSFVRGNEITCLTKEGAVLTEMRLLQLMKKQAHPKCRQLLFVEFQRICLEHYLNNKGTNSERYILQLRQMWPPSVSIYSYG